MSGIKPALLKIQKQIDKILEDIVTEHKMKRKASNNTNGDEQDLVDTLLNLRKIISLSFISQPIKSKQSPWQDLESSATTIERAMSELLRNPRVMEKAQSEL
ncbi:cytochrome P450 CYP71D312-like [Prunus yedoensis var. nudiflora]|uniref:Cytochrome P450 CYP71D312-like n=1 Tax=Prunus yedoensis var. nudiflora TaxID=2094558 RepID=A0A314YU71_PRUYE|nr:cytochrome P450 CYP71D312-like [Prunus yedoensis var. nudiflora]